MSYKQEYLGLSIVSRDCGHRSAAIRRTPRSDDCPRKEGLKASAEPSKAVRKFKWDHRETLMTRG